VKIFERLRRFSKARAAAWVLRRQGQDVLPTTIQRRRIYILPTRGGIGFALLILTMLIAGLNYTNSLAMFLTFLLSGFALVAMHQCHRNLLNLKLVDAATLPAFAGERAGVAVTLVNESRAPRYRIEMRASEQDRVSTVDLDARSTKRMDLSVRTAKRGPLKLQRLHLTTTHPFGLFRAWTWVHIPLTVMVYPKPHGTRPMPAESGRKQGPHLRGGAGEDEWVGLRTFRDGDSPRQVAWKAYARGAPLLVKEYGSSGSELRLFDFHQLAPLDVEARLEQISRWIVDAESRGERYGILLLNHRIEPDEGMAHQHRCLTALALHGVTDGAATNANARAA
jgi:uncharacterized protein (DUF58 family)